MKRHKTTEKLVQPTSSENNYCLITILLSLEKIFEERKCSTFSHAQKVATRSDLSDGESNKWWTLKHAKNINQTPQW